MENKLQKISVAGLLVIDGKTLLVRRSQKETFLPGAWELPGGKVNFGEDPEKALVREFAEEVGLTINVIKPLRVFQYISQEGKRQTVEIVFLVSCDSQDLSINLSEAHDKWILFDPQNQPEVVIDEQIRKSLELV